MKVLELIRLEDSRLHGTFGILKVSKRLFCYTLEPHDRENGVNSSIPTGQYLCGAYSSIRHNTAYEVKNVTGRTKILIHPGNVDDETRGCILIGETLGKLKGRSAVLNSGKTFSRLRELLGEDDFHLTITEAY